MMNRRFLTFSLIAAFVVMLISCDTGFDALNTDETSLTSVDPVLQFNNAVVNSAPVLANIQCESSIVKQQMRIFTGVGACGNFNVDGRETSNSNWNNGYQTRIRNLVDVIRNTEGDADRANLYHMARIWRAYSFMILTDSYGDIPYTQAGLGFIDGVVFPEYDSQEFIYTSDVGILAELASAASSLSASAPTVSQDVLYGGNVEQWRKFGYSLLLRAAMRLSKVNPTLAEQYANTAVQGGLMESNDDNAAIRHTSEFVNGPGNALNGGQSHFQYLVEDFVVWMQDHDDPRLVSIAVRYPTAVSSGDHNEANADRDPANQIGIPMGYDNNDIGPVAEAQGLPSFMAYSQVDRTRMMDPQAPSFLATYALQQLLLAEAAHRDWVSGNASDYYESGIEAHMQQFADYGEHTEIDQADIAQYIQDNPLEAGRELELINTQYWAASYLIGPESWANFRRSGYPDLTPNPRQDDLTQENFIRRFGYPDAERSVNPNVEQGTTPDRIDTRVWWDVP